MSDIRKIILSWWGSQLNRETSKGKALSARLRRATNVEILCEFEVHRLAQNLELTDADRLLRIVTVLAEVRQHSEVPLACVFGGAEPKLSNLRFQRLMRANGDDFITALRRSIPMAGRRCNVAALGEDLMFWNESTRMKWCFNYFGADAPRPISEEAPA